MGGDPHPEDHEMYVPSRTNSSVASSDAADVDQALRDLAAACRGLSRSRLEQLREVAEDVDAALAAGATLNAVETVLRAQCTSRPTPEPPAELPPAWRGRR